jgi:hypothetical protein
MSGGCYAKKHNLGDLASAGELERGMGIRINGKVAWRR